MAQPVETPGHWYGKVGLTGGYGHRIIKDETQIAPDDTLTHVRGEAALQLGYRSPKFSFSTQMKGQWTGKGTLFDRCSVTGQEKLDLKYRRTELRQPSGSWRSDFQWKPSERSQFTTFVLYQIERDKTHGESFDYKMDLEKDETEDYRFSLEERHHWKHTVQTGWRSTHNWPDRRLTLLTQFDGTTRLHKRHSVWEEQAMNRSRSYLLTPQSDYHEGKAMILLRNDDFLGVPTLRAEGGLQVRSAYTEDRNAGMTQIAPDVWRDSVRLKERFNHLALWIEPGVNADYQPGNWHLRAEGVLQWYGEQLTDERHFRDIAWEKPIPVGRVLTEWTPSKMHTVSVIVSHAVKQPTYVQRCWYERQDANANQLFRGNPALEASHNQEINLIYTFRHEHFNASSQTRMTYRTNEVEQTFTNETIDGRQYKVFTWLNTAFGETFSQVITAGWAGKVFSANSRINYVQKLQQSATNDREVRTHHWEFSADASCRPGNGWLFSARGAYVGDVQTLYTLLQGYCSLNASIEKAFKKVTVFVEGRDLLDQPVEKSFSSADLSEVWSQTEYLNRRVFLAGFTWAF